ncbi:histidine kinase [Nonlabens sp. MB-3u-79]|uniref:sensor histidine kinase n=1 Tax=Nonlabens sp. MB-3u-79 TaxID=2058134 RepID=UPI000C2FFF3A|nr:histidine kinase [Nonlabens sp. MB-3u-79]AUC79138.1 histidine kinase [Nonlabens sp. MB-3u-79]|tara:strand:+ start:1000 stop:1650 length:651 start_codon:yes stop_codon:yes gene_type:complete
MEGIIGNIFIGLLLGLVIIYFLAAADRQEQNDKRQQRGQEQNRRQLQRDQILKELAHRPSENSIPKTKAVTLLYQFAASKNHFTLKDIEQGTRILQRHYAESIENKMAYKMNFPEKELLRFEPKETLQLLAIINEALYNSVTHSQASFVFSIASVAHGKLNVITHDNGIGYDRRVNPDHNGINSIKKAVQDLKGDLKLTSSIGNGTIVNVEIPIHW